MHGQVEMRVLAVAGGVQEGNEGGMDASLRRLNGPSRDVTRGTVQGRGTWDEFPDKLYVEGPGGDRHRPVADFACRLLPHSASAWYR